MWIVVVLAFAFQPMDSNDIDCYHVTKGADYIGTLFLFFTKEACAWRCELLGGAA